MINDYCFNRHNLLLDNLLIAHKYLIHSYIKKTETTKGTNWKQKFQKPQNENIYLTNLNVESLCKPRVEPNLVELYRGTAKFR